jgi:tetratricopeptide (TPR) repeat protein
MNRALDILPVLSGVYFAVLIIYFVAKHISDTARPRRRARKRFNSGLDRMIMQDYSKAIAEFQGVVEIFPLSAETWFLIGVSWYNLGDHNEAIDSFRECLLLDDRHAEAYDWLGVSCVKLGMYEVARDCFREAAYIAPREGDFWRNRAVAEYMCKSVDSAIESLEQALKLKPDLPRAWGTLGDFYAAKGDFDRALECFDRDAQG